MTEYKHPKRNSILRIPLLLLKFSDILVSFLKYEPYSRQSFYCR